MRSSRRHAFTLFEIMLALMIAVMVIAISIPSIDGLLAERRARASFDAFDGMVGKALDEAVARREPRRIVWQKDRVVIAAGEMADPQPEAVGIDIGKGESYRIEFPAALIKNPPADWTIWPTGTCEPAIVRYEGPQGNWKAVYDPLTVHPDFSTDEK